MRLSFKREPPCEYLLASYGVQNGIIFNSGCTRVPMVPSIVLHSSLTTIWCLISSFARMYPTTSSPLLNRTLRHSIRNPTTHLLPPLLSYKAKSSVAVTCYHQNWWSPSTSKVLTAISYLRNRMRSYRSKHHNVYLHAFSRQAHSFSTLRSHAPTIPNSDSRSFSPDSLDPGPLLTVTTIPAPSVSDVYAVLMSKENVSESPMMDRGPVCRIFYLKDGHVNFKFPVHSRILTTVLHCKP